MSVLPILIYDNPVLHKKTDPVQENSPELQQLIDDMFETMYHANGVGLAAPQVNRMVRVFVADADQMLEDEDEEPTYGKRAFINPEIIFEGDRRETVEEGCLSIPGVYAPVERPVEIVIKYLDRNLEEQEMNVQGVWARVLQHELDHLNGVLFLDHLSMFKRKLLSSKLNDIDDGTIEVDYPVS